MAQNLFQKIIASHLEDGEPLAGREIALRIDQVLTQDATGTLVYLELEAMGVERIKPLAVSYVDHNTLQTGPENADDYLYLMGITSKLGAFFSPPGNGICHRLHLERFAKPGQTLLGSDSHTPTAGALAMVAIGAGGMDVALAMAGRPFYLMMPEVWLVQLKGELPAWVSSKDVILELLRRLTVKGGYGKAFEYGGEGVKSLSVPERATIANMGAELGATTSVFPSDHRSRAFLWTQGRPEDWIPLEADPDAPYDGEITIDLEGLEPLIALPSSPDNVRAVREVEGKKVDQVVVGSCTNSSFHDLALVAEVLATERIHPRVDLVIVPGSRQVLDLLAEGGQLEKLIRKGARVLEPACGPCIGMGQAPPSGGVSLRTFNRNFRGRSGTPDAEVYLVSPETAVAAAITGEITDPRRLGTPPSISAPLPRWRGEDLFLPPAEDPSGVEVRRGPNIKPLPPFAPLPEELEGEVLLVLGDDISTDDILPAGAEVLPLRSNIPAISRFAFSRIDPTFSQRAERVTNGVIVAGENYGQGSSREHAALAPRWLGVRAVVAKSFARIHRANLINFGILPLTFVDPADHKALRQGDRVKLSLGDLRGEIPLHDLDRGVTVRLRHDLSPREREIVRAGGAMNLVRREA